MDHVHPDKHLISDSGVLAITRDLGLSRGFSEDTAIKTTHTCRGGLARPHTRLYPVYRFPSTEHTPINPHAPDTKPPQRSQRTEKPPSPTPDPSNRGSRLNGSPGGRSDAHAGFVLVAISWTDALGTYRWATSGTLWIVYNSAGSTKQVATSRTWSGDAIRLVISSMHETATARRRCTICGAQGCSEWLAARLPPKPQRTPPWTRT